jgi:hypothetical protein
MFDMFFLSSNCMNVTIATTPFIIRSDISMFSIMITKAPNTIFLYVQNEDL